MPEQVNKEQQKDANQESVTELPEGQLEEVVGGGPSPDPPDYREDTASRGHEIGRLPDGLEFVSATVSNADQAGIEEENKTP